MGTLTKAKGDVLFDIINVTFFIVVLAIVVYPLYFMLIASFSDPTGVNNGQVWLWPKQFNLAGYKYIFADSSIWLGYRNSLIYLVTGTIINVVLTISGGYVLSRKDLIGGKIVMLLIIFTMFFKGGLIPTYLLVKDLGMVNTIWAMVIPNAMTAFNLIIARTFFQSNIPNELFEAASMDGCNNWKFFLRIVIPLSKSIIAVIALFSAVEHWNAYFNALIYIRDSALQPLQIVLRQLLIVSQAQDMSASAEEMMEQQNLAELIKYGVVIVAIVPMLILYPFVQKYFVQGVMIGSIKG